MPINKIEGVRADDIVFHYNGDWYCIPFVMLITIPAAQLRYGLVPSASVALDEDITTGPNVVMTPELKVRNQVEELRFRWRNWSSNPVDDIKALIDRNPDEFTAVLASCLIP